jgi:hypothetical protein
MTASIKVQGFTVKRELKIIHRKGKHISRVAGALIETAQKLID